MNQAYRLVWSVTQQAWTVASELARGNKKTSARTLSAAAILLGVVGAGSAYAAPASNALPTGESLVSGSATFDRSVANQLTVNQSTSKLITNWNSFDVGSAGQVQFVQPDSSSVALNRVTSASPSEIFGQVSANGQLMIVNPNGIVFGAGSQVSAAAILASVLDISDTDFNNDELFFERNGVTGSIENHGTLTATSGTVALLAPTITNSGSIVAAGGDANLMSADRVAGYGADLSESSTIGGIIKNSGSIQASGIDRTGGRITLSGDSSDASSKVILSGSLEAEWDINAFGRNLEVSDTLALNGTTYMGADDNVYINADVNVAAGNSLNLFHGEGAANGYFLNYGAKVNLNGPDAGFSVNESSYTVIQDINQLQAIADLGGRYVLGSDIDASNSADWDNGRGFAPLASAGSPFSGQFDGLGHSINQLSINRSTTDYVGLFAASQNASLRNVGFSAANIIGRQYVGALVGRNTADAGISQIFNSHVAGTITGNSYVGGLAGYNLALNAGDASFRQNYAVATINGLSSTFEYTSIGGLIGRNEANSGATANIEQNFANVSVIAQGGGVGGIVGTNISDAGTASMRYNYVLGSVSSNGFDIGGMVGELDNRNGGTANFSHNFGSATIHSTNNFRGALIGWNTNGLANISFNYWDTEKAGDAGSATSNEDANTTIGLNTAQSMQLASYANWNGLIDAEGNTGTVWRIYEGQSAPLLRVFMKPMTVSADSVTRTYDATAFTTGSYSLSDVAANVAHILGSAVYAGNAIGARHAGAYGLTVSGLYSDQLGYDLSFAGGQLTINKAALSISSTSASKTYDGTTSASASAVIADGTLYGTDSISGGMFNFDNKNAGTNKHVIVSAVNVSDGNGGNNYDVTYVDNTASTINKKLLTIAAAADSKVYDGRLWSNIRPVVTGRVSGDSIAGLSQVFTDKNAGTGKTLVVDAGFVIRDGNKGNNYEVVVLDNHAGVITPKALSISTVANSKVYDGGVTSVNKPLVEGLAYGDRVTGLFQQYETKTVGENKKLLIKNGYVVQDGNAGGNYIVTEQGSNDGVITAH
jgi:filamentous hemagglutinin family protein